MEIKYLPWDSESFGFKVGKLCCSITPIESDFHKLIKEAQENGYQLLYCYDCYFPDHFLSDFFILADEKVIYTLTVTKQKYNDSNEIISELYKPLRNDLLLLSLECGGCSRFYLDKNMPIHAYLTLYSAWIKKSLEGTIASDVLVYKMKDKSIGLLTYKVTGNNVTIGLLVVDNSYKGLGIGSKLLHHLFSLFPMGTIVEVATQRNNIGACRFYEKNGFRIKKTQKIYHLWVNDYYNQIKKQNDSF